MPLATASLPDDLAAAHAMILAERAARLEAEAAVASARLEIERLKLLLAKARRVQYGQSSERGAKLVEQLELQRSKPLVIALEAWLRAQYERVSRKAEIGKAIAYTLNHWQALTRFLEDGRICISNNATERALRGIAVGRKNWTFAGSDRGGERAATIYTLIETCKLNKVDSQAWLADVLARLPDHPAKRIGALLPWAWKAAHPA